MVRLGRDRLAIEFLRRGQVAFSPIDVGCVAQHVGVAVPRCDDLAVQLQRLVVTEAAREDVGEVGGDIDVELRDRAGGPEQFLRAFLVAGLGVKRACRVQDFRVLRRPLEERVELIDGAGKLPFRPQDIGQTTTRLRAFRRELDRAGVVTRRLGVVVGVCVCVGEVEMRGRAVRGDLHRPAQDVRRPFRIAGRAMRRAEVREDLGVLAVAPGRLGKKIDSRRRIVLAQADGAEDMKRIGIVGLVGEDGRTMAAGCIEIAGAKRLDRIFERGA